MRARHGVPDIVLRLAVDGAKLGDADWHGVPADVVSHRDGAVTGFEWTTALVGLRALGRVSVFVFDAGRHGRQTSTQNEDVVTPRAAF